MSFEKVPNFLANLFQAEMSGDNLSSYRFKSFLLNVAERQLTCDNEPVPLTPKAFDVLVYLVTNGGHLVHKDELMQAVWPDSFVEEVNLPRIIHTLRRALGEDNNANKFIETVPTKGYRFVCEARELDGGPVGPRSREQPTNGYDPVAESITRPTEKSDASGAERDRLESRESRTWLWSLSAVTGLGLVVIIAGFSLNLWNERNNHIPKFEQMTQTRLTQSGDVYGPVISPDGQYLEYCKLGADTERGLELLQIATGRILQLVPMRPGIRFWGAAFSRDGNYLYYVENKDNDLGVLFRIPSLGGQPQKIIDFVSGPVTIAPDGKRIAFVRIDKQAGVSSIIVIKSDSSDEQTLATIDTNSLYMSIDWSPDNESIAYVVRHREPKNDSWYVADISAAGGSERRIGEPRGTRIIAARWLPNKNGLVLNAIDPKTKLAQISYLTYPDGVERMVTNDLNEYFGVSISADGRSIVSQRNEANQELWILPDKNGQEARQLTFKKDQQLNSVNWLTDDTLIFDTNENNNNNDRNVWRLKIGDEGAQPLTTGHANDTWPSVSPDGKSIAFVSSRSGRQQIWRMNSDGTRPTQVTDMDLDIFNLQFSPDGQWVYFKTSIDGEGRVMRVPANGGEAVSVIDGDVYEWAISSDGERLAYSCLDRQTQKVIVRIRPIDEDRTEQTLDIEPDSEMLWADGDKSLYFTMAADESRNIWKQGLTETQPSRLTNFDNERVFRFALSPAGKDLAALRFSVTFDAILLNFDK